eukprot:GHVL01013869.1.p1 GENE.GHVL01013869.1~~GHVL01013869.1.p1  ORF type:complete len:372 (-),score=56.60 GHVL01013869.1:2013-3128(-)
MTEYSALQSDIVTKFLDVAASYWPVVEKLSTVLATADVLASFALVSSNAPIPYVRPTIDRSGNVLDLKQARHPILEMRSAAGSFIANDCSMIWEESRLHVISGPNMGGKSTYLRQAALIVIMNQIGCFVPCDSATLPILRQVMCRVGASDVQLRGVSTFLAEMMETSCILKIADRQSLVIIDELGRGTSTYEGFGLAWAIAEYLGSEVGCFCLFATHFHELSALAEECDGVVNRHVTAVVENNGNLTFLYEVREGSCDQSFGVHVASMAKIPESVVENSKKKSEELEQVDFLSAAKKQKKFALTNDTTTDIEMDDGSEKLDQAIADLGNVVRMVLTDPKANDVEGVREVINLNKKEITETSQRWLGSVASA